MTETIRTPTAAIAPPVDEDEAAYYALRLVRNVRIEGTQMTTDVLAADYERYNERFGLGAIGRDYELINGGSNRYSAAKTKVLIDENGPIVTLDEYRAAIAEGISKAPSSGRIKNPYATTDLGNAERFRDRKGHLVRYVHPKRHWLAWGGHRWVPDSGQVAMSLAMDLMRELVAEAQLIDDDAERKKTTGYFLHCQSLGSIRAMLELAKNLAPIADNGQGWDTDPDLLGCQNGVIQFDPETGDFAFRPGRPEDRITKTVAVNYVEEAECPSWLAFRTQVHPSLEIRRWTALALGYSLSGHVTEQVSFWGHGNGANGKTTELETIADILGNYAWTLPFKTLIGHRSGENTNDLAALAGKRFVLCSEVPVGAHTNEQRLKALSGGDTVTARFLHEEYFEFRPAAKFWFAVNHRPASKDESEGYWRRIRLIPYTQHFAADTEPKADPDLRDKLRAEYEGIFAWLVRQAGNWYAERLGIVPDAVRAATAEYRAENDPLGSFIKTACIHGRQYEVQAKVFYHAFIAWCRGGEVDEADLLSQTAVGQRIKSLGYKKHARSQGTFYEGLALVTDDYQPSMALADRDEEAA